jgi:hypothetical protein
MNITEILSTKLNIDPQLVDWVIQKSGVDIQKLTPPNLEEANFVDMN